MIAGCVCVSGPLMRTAFDLLGLGSLFVWYFSAHCDLGHMCIALSSSQVAINRCRIHTHAQK